MSDAGLRCDVCHHRCLLSEGKTGFCRARKMQDGRIVPVNYGTATSVALDPIEKKPLARFFPGSNILSYGSFGCNLRCPFCQNWEISMSDGKEFVSEDRDGCYISPQKLASLADELRSRGNIGVAFTYNEPLICWEYVLDTARLLRKKGLKTVLVTNGCVNEDICRKVLPYVDALNIDLKAFRAETYEKVLGGDLETVKRFIAMAAESCHVELTTLIVPGMNDSEEEIRALSEWITSLPFGRDIPLHITRFFPRYRMEYAEPTRVRSVLHLADIAKEYLRYVYPGNI